MSSALPASVTECRTLRSWAGQALQSDEKAGRGQICLCTEAACLQKKEPLGPDRLGATVGARWRLGLYLLSEAATHCISKTLKIVVFQVATAFSAGRS